VASITQIVKTLLDGFGFCLLVQAVAELNSGRLT